ncbi:MAG: hypothetical protein NXI31_06445 [bacterium]|nr:hypothetical protein [bacterium]
MLGPSLTLISMTPVTSYAAQSAFDPAARAVGSRGIGYAALGIALLEAITLLAWLTYSITFMM